MPLFGVDDLLLVLASTSAFLLARRGSLPRIGFTRAGDYHNAPIALLRELSPSRAACTDASPLIRTGVAGHFHRCCPTPVSPGRHYNQHKVTPHVSTLVHCDEDAVARDVKRYRRAEVQTLFDSMEREDLWESVVRVSRGIELAGLRWTHLSQINVEAGLRTLLRHAPPQLAVGYYLSYAEDMLLGDDILVPLCDACRHNARASVDLYRNLKPFQSRWTPTAFACCLTITAHHLPDEAFELYDHYRGNKPFATAVISPTTRSICFLYHVIVPLALRHRPERVGRYVADMLRYDPDAAADVFLKCLGMPGGHALAVDYVRRRGGDDVGDACGAIAMALYRGKPTAMNMNTLLEVVLGEPGAAAVGVDWEKLGQLLREVPLSSDVDAAILARTAVEHNAPLPLVEAFLAAMLARRCFAVVPTLAEHAMRHGGWAVAARAMTIALSNRRGVLTKEDVRLCVEASVRAGRWSSALFWMERARGLATPPTAPDTPAALVAATACSGGTTRRACPAHDTVPPLGTAAADAPSPS